MKNGIYSIRDRVAGSFAKPFVSTNDDTAKRDFAISLDGVPSKQIIAMDYELHRIGEFDNETGEVVGVPDLIIARGEDYV